MTTETINWTPKRIHRLRILVRGTQGLFAARVGVGRSALTAWEAGKKNPSLKHQAALDKIASDAGLTGRSLDQELTK